MSTMQSTVRRVEEDEARKAEGHVDGWQPAGPALTAGDTIGMAEIERGKDWLASNEDAPRRTFENLPSIGHLVVYHLRDGDSRNMRTKFPATVLDVDQSTGLLSLIITVDAGDEWRQDHVPPRAAPEPGWELVDRAPNSLTDDYGLPAEHLKRSAEELSARVAALEAELTEMKMASAPLMVANGTISDEDLRAGRVTWYDPNGTIQKISDRISALEAKRGPGRPPKPKDE